MKADDYVNPQEVLSPKQCLGEPLNYVSTKGLTVRDHIAIEAMNSIQLILDGRTDFITDDTSHSLLAELCYKRADAMIAQSNETNT